MTRGMNGSDIKRSNRGLFLKNIALGKANSRIALSKLTGLAKMTAGNIVQELLSMGLIENGDPIQVDSTGPNPMQLKISEKAPKIVGVYISRDELVFSIGDLSGNLHYTKKATLENENKMTVETKLINGINEAINYENGNILAIGVAMIGPIDNDGSIVNSPNFFKIQSLPVKKIINKHFPYPTVIYNDISAAAVAEQLIGNGEYSNFIFIGNSNGLGAGIIYNGELMIANRSFIGEFGHITIDSKGEKCPCGNTGCLELYATVKVLCERLSSAIGVPISPADFERLSEYPECDAIFRDVSLKLSAGMISLTNLLNPEAFVLGYDGYYLPDCYIELIEQNINNTKFIDDGRKIRVEKAFFKADSAIYGSICCVLREIFKGEILFNN